MLPEKLNDNRENIQELLAIWRIDQEIAHRIDPNIISSALIYAEITRIEALPIVPELEDRQDEAKLIKDETIFHLYRQYSIAKHYEAERAWIAEQAAAKAKQRAEERQAIAHERQAQLEALLRKEREAQEDERSKERETKTASERAELRANAHEKGLALREHEAAIHREVLADLCDIGLAEATAHALICAIARGGVAHLSITY